MVHKHTVVNASASSVMQAMTVCLSTTAFQSSVTRCQTVEDSTLAAVGLTGEMSFATLSSVTYRLLRKYTWGTHLSRLYTWMTRLDSN